MRRQRQTASARRQRRNARGSRRAGCRARQRRAGCAGRHRGQSSSHSGANIACCAACTTAGRSGRSAKRDDALDPQQVVAALAAPARRARGRNRAGSTAPPRIDARSVSMPWLCGGDRLGTPAAAAGARRVRGSGAAEQHRAPGSVGRGAEDALGAGVERVEPRVRVAAPNGARSVFEITSASATATCRAASAKRSSVAAPVTASTRVTTRARRRRWSSIGSAPSVKRIGAGSARPLVSMTMRRNGRDLAGVAPVDQARAGSAPDPRAPRSTGSRPAVRARCPRRNRRGSGRSRSRRSR